MSRIPKMPGYEFIEMLDSFGVQNFAVSALFFFGSWVSIFIYAPDAFFWAVKWLIFLFPLWGPLYIASVGWYFWHMYVEDLFMSTLTHTVLEVKLPRSNLKTPAAMEYLFAGLHVHASGASVFYRRWWRGDINPVWAFELHSYEGHIHFYIRTENRTLELVKAQFYAQYPGVQLEEIRDPFSGFKFNHDTMEAYGIEFVKAHGNPLPLKSYLDFGLDNVFIADEERSDPLCDIFEAFSSLGTGEQWVIQIMIQKDIEGLYFPLTWIQMRSGDLAYKHEAKEAIEEIYEKAAIGYTDIESGNEKKGSSQLTPLDVDQIKALERVIAKHSFRTGIRGLYFSKKENHDYKQRSTRIVHTFRQFHSSKFNSLKTGRRYWHQPLDFPWQDFHNLRRRHFSYQIFNAVRTRQIFYPPFEHMVTHMNPEELATIYHFPSDECRAPGIARIQSRASKAPANIPT